MRRMYCCSVLRMTVPPPRAGPRLASHFDVSRLKHRPEKKSPFWYPLLRRTHWKRNDTHACYTSTHSGTRRKQAKCRGCSHTYHMYVSYEHAVRCLLQVVSVKIPPSKVPEFAKAYFDMFVTYDNGAGRVFLDRRDTQVQYR